MREESADTCSACPPPRWVDPSRVHPNYDHIHFGELPRARRSESHQITHGYAVELNGSELPTFWIWFRHQEPAIAFGRAGRMAEADVTAYNVYPAAREARFDSGRRRDITTLHISGPSLRDHGTGEHALLQRWVDGTSPNSAYWMPPSTAS